MVGNTHPARALSSQTTIHDPLPLRSGFTLVEILVVIMIIALLAGLILAVAGSAISSSKENATKVLLDQVQKALEARMDKFLQDTKNGMPIAKYQIMAGASTTAAVEPNSVVGKRAAILARMDSMRSAFPQYFSEILPSQEVLNVYSNPTVVNPITFATEMENQAEIAANPSNNFGLATAPVINPYQTHQTLLLKYLVDGGFLQSNQQYSSEGGIDWATGATAGTTLPRPTTIPNQGSHDPETESAECLYLILSDNTVGDNVLEGIKNSIKDTDGDGLMEIVDAWGQPIKYYRWPTDLFAYWIEISRQLPVAGAKNTLDPDGLLYAYNPTNPNDPVGSWLSSPVKEYFETIAGRLHPAYGNTPNLTYLQTPTDNLTIQADAHTGANTDRAGEPREYPFRPIIVSAGPDGEFGMYDRETVIPGVGNPAQHPVHFLGIRCGRVVEDEDEDEQNFFDDNLFSIELQEGIRR